MKKFEKILSEMIDYPEQANVPVAASISPQNSGPINFVKNFLNVGKASEKNIGFDDVSQDELSMGISVEFEHTNHRDIAKKIALDHLAEIPDYYTRLRRMEDEAKRPGEKAE